MPKGLLKPICIIRMHHGKYSILRCTEWGEKLAIVVSPSMLILPVEFFARAVGEHCWSYEGSFSFSCVYLLSNTKRHSSSLFKRKIDFPALSFAL